MSSALNGDTTVTDLALLELWRKERDADSFARIVARHSPMVYSTCCRILKDPTEAEDISQECFLKLASCRGRLDRCLGSWLHVVATRLCLNRIESRKHRWERERLSAERARCVEDRRRWDDISEAVDEAIAGLPAKLRDSIIERFFEGRTYEAIAGSLGIPRPTAAKRVRKGIEAIRASLRRKGVLVPSTALVLFLGQQTGQAVPRSLARELGKIALAGGTGSKGTLATTGGVLLMTTSKKLGLAAFIVVTLALIVASSLHRRRQSPREMGPQPATKVATVTGAPREANDLGKRWSPPERAEEGPAAAKVAQESRAVKPGSISGRVRNQQDEPIVAAQVEVEVCKDATGIQVLKTFLTETDENGMYAVSGIDVFGSAHVYAAAEGYSTGRAERDLSPGLDLTGINMTLRKAVTAVEG